MNLFVNMPIIRKKEVAKVQPPMIEKVIVTVFTQDQEGEFYDKVISVFVLPLVI